RTSGRPKSAKNGDSRVTQTRVVLRVTKPGSRDEATISRKQIQVIKTEEPEDVALEEDDDNEERSPKRIRTVIKTEEEESRIARPESTMPDNNTTEPAKVKPDGAEDWPEPKPKLL